MPADTDDPRHPGVYAERTPDRPAVILAGSGARLDFAAFEAFSNRFARLLRGLGLGRGDRAAVLLENHLFHLPLFWGALRLGLRPVAIPTHLRPEDIAYILADSGARVLVTSAAMAEAATALRFDGAPEPARFMLDGTRPGFAALEEALAALPATPPEGQAEGVEMLYSSGTTGRPKGVEKDLPAEPFGYPSPGTRAIMGLYGIDENAVYLTPAPLYHAAPLLFSLRALRFGATVVVMEKFDAEACLRAIGRHRVTHGQWVPTMFVRMLRLPEEVRAGYDISSLRCAIHAAAPCPVEVKRRIIDWFGPVVREYYGGSEGNGLTVIDSGEWLARPGSVGRAILGRVRICGEDGEELPAGREGGVYFSDGPAFAYRNDPGKTAASRNRQGWSTLGDVGYVDGEGYLYLTDRKANVIISGGVNIYPQEAENLLLSHPAVLDAAVVGAPDEEFGERATAVVHPVDMGRAGPELAAELIAWCRARLGPVKSPRAVDFDDNLPRGENGKLYKRLLKDRYWRGTGRRIAGG